MGMAHVPAEPYDETPDWCIGATIEQLDDDGGMRLTKNGQVRRVKVVGTTEMQATINKLQHHIVDWKAATGCQTPEDAERLIYHFKDALNDIENDYNTHEALLGFKITAGHKRCLDIAMRALYQVSISGRQDVENIDPPPGDEPCIR